MLLYLPILLCTDVILENLLDCNVYSNLLSAHSKEINIAPQYDDNFKLVFNNLCRFIDLCILLDITTGSFIELILNVDYNLEIQKNVYDALLNNSTLYKFTHGSNLGHIFTSLFVKSCNKECEVDIIEKSIVNIFRVRHFIYFAERDIYMVDRKLTSNNPVQFFIDPVIRRDLKESFELILADGTVVIPQLYFFLINIEERLHICIKCPNDEYFMVSGGKIELINQEYMDMLVGMDNIIFRVYRY